MTATTAPARARTASRLLAALVAVAALVGTVISALPSVLSLLDPLDTLIICPAVWPPVTSCAPRAHLVVVGVAVVVLVSGWLLADVLLHRATSLSTRAGVLAGLTVIALVAWSAARVPQPYFALWSRLFG